MDLGVFTAATNTACFSSATEMHCIEMHCIEMHCIEMHCICIVTMNRVSWDSHGPPFWRYGRFPGGGAQAWKLAAKRQRPPARCQVGHQAHGSAASWRF